MTTPEGRVKEIVKAFLKERKVRTLSHPIPGAVGFYRMHVPSGYGEPALDFEGNYKGYYWAIEAKAEGNVPSAIQKQIMKMHHETGVIFSDWGDNGREMIVKLTTFFDHVDTLV